MEVWRTQTAAPLRVANDFSAIVHSRKLPAALERIVGMGGTVVAAVDGDELSGYATVVPSATLVRERWQDLPDAFELGSIEVARSSRRHGIGSALVERLEALLPVDRMLLFARGMYGHWETEAAMLSAFEYRGMLLRMLRRAGFERWDTQDPEVLDHALNFLAVRAGRDAPAASVAAFARCAAAPA